MGAKDSNKKLKRKKITAEKSEEENSELGHPQIAQAADELHSSGGKKKSKKLRDNKRKKDKITKTVTDELDTHLTDGVGNGISDREVVGNDPGEDKLKKSRKKKRKNSASVNKVDEFHQEEDASEQRNEGNVLPMQSKTEDHTANSEGLNKADTRTSSINGKSKKSRKSKKKSQSPATEPPQEHLLQKEGEEAEDEVYQMSSGDEDYSKGMKKWISQYYQSRPGLKVLQERIDEFIMDHEAKEEQARAEREAQLAEGGWTVVVQQKGRKKSTDAESGIAVGSVAPTAVLDKMAKKKKKEVGIDFYQFQKREARRNEIVMLQSKFEQDKKRIQQMRAARKFRPY